MSRVPARLAAAALLVLASSASAENNSPSIEALLTANNGKQVTLRLEGGQEITGTVAALSSSTVKLSGLVGKEYYGAVIRLERIAAVIVREQSK